MSTAVCELVSTVIIGGRDPRIDSGAIADESACRPSAAGLFGLRRRKDDAHTTRIGWHIANPSLWYDEGSDPSRQRPVSKVSRTCLRERSSARHPSPASGTPF